jgi:uncharacterized membrane protein YebE (DUF533 family)
MFDAKSLLENLVRNAAPQNTGAQSGSGGGGLADILGQVLGGGAGSGAGGQAGGQGGGLSDILEQLQRQMAPSQNAGGPGSGGGATAGGGLGDILGQIKDQLDQAGGSLQGGSVLDTLGKVLGQATQGAREGATKIDSATGASGALRDALQNATGKNPDEILAQLQQILKDNPLAAGGALGGLGGILLGTRTGRSVIGGAAKLGALALISGLAYKAYQNYQQGKPMISGATPVEAAPQGSGFEAAAATNEDAALYIQTMIAAAAADGRLDADEQRRIMGGLTQAGAGAEAEQFLANTFNRPPTVAQIADAVSSPEQAVQVYTAARIAIDPDTTGEKQFLTGLAQALGIDAKLAQHIDATARNAA